MSSLKERIQARHMDNHILLPGLVHQASIYLRAFDCFIFPSIREGFGLALLEAMCASLPTITSLSAALPEVVGNTGLQFHAHNSDELANRLQNMLDMTPNERKLMGKAGFKRLSSEFSTSSFDNKLRTLLEL